MPIEHKTFGCAFKCGRRHSPKESIIATHEKTCWHNPALKTCLSCSNQVSRKHYESHDELPGSPVEEWHERGCLHSYGEKLIEDNYESLKTKTGWVKPIVGCPAYNIDPPEDVDPEFCDAIVRSRIKSYEERDQESPF